MTDEEVRKCDLINRLTTLSNTIDGNLDKLYGWIISGLLIAVGLGGIIWLVLTKFGDNGGKLKFMVTLLSGMLLVIFGVCLHTYRYKSKLEIIREIRRVGELKTKSEISGRIDDLSKRLDELTNKHNDKHNELRDGFASRHPTSERFGWAIHPEVADELIQRARAQKVSAETLVNFLLVERLRGSAGPG